MTLTSNLINDEPQDLAPVLTPNASIVLEKRYLLQNERGEVIETPTQLLNE